MINLERKKVLLTGASGGIGKAIANELSSLGAVRKKSKECFGN